MVMEEANQFTCYTTSLIRHVYLFQLQLLMLLIFYWVFNHIMHDCYLLCLVWLKKRTQIFKDKYDTVKSFIPDIPWLLLYSEVSLLMKFSAYWQ